MKRSTLFWGICALSVLAAFSFGGTWSDPVLLTELNLPGSSQNAAVTSLSSDGKTLYYGLRDSASNRRLYEAHRDNKQSPFDSIQEISELFHPGKNLYNPWVSSDGLRLYYQRYEGYGVQNVFRVATRTDMNSPWVDFRGFWEIHSPHAIDQTFSLTPDELTIYYATDAENPKESLRIWKATRSSINDNFSNPTLINELNFGLKSAAPFIAPDELTIYFSNLASAGGVYDLYKATRTSVSEPFSNIERLNISTDLSDVGFYMTPDESELFFSNQAGIWYSQYIKDAREESIEQIQKAMEHDENALAEIEKSLDAKYQAIEELTALLEEVEEHPDLTKADILKSIASLKNAINVEENSKEGLSRSIESLQDILDFLIPETE